MAHVFMSYSERDNQPINSHGFVAYIKPQGALEIKWKKVDIFSQFC